MRSFSQLWPTLKRLLAYGSPWRKPLGIALRNTPAGVVPRTPFTRKGYAASVKRQSR